MAEEKPNRGRTMKVILGIIGLLLIAILILLWLLSQAPEISIDPNFEGNPIAVETPELNPTRPAGGLVTPTPGDIEPPPAEPSPEPDRSAALGRLAMAFVERYGSYSNQSEFSNLLDLKALMTQAMAVRTDQLIERARANLDTEGYSSTVTRSLSSNVDDLDKDAGDASVTVTTQRRAATGIAADRVYYQEANVEFVESNGQWLVSSITWLEERDTPAE